MGFIQKVCGLHERSRVQKKLGTPKPVGVLNKPSQGQRAHPHASEAGSHVQPFDLGSTTTHQAHPAHASGLASHLDQVKLAASSLIAAAQLKWAWVVSQQ
jgi:hypothetical protein